MRERGIKFEDLSELIRNMKGKDLGEERDVREREVKLKKKEG